MGRQVKVTKYGVHRSIPYSQLETFKEAGWKAVQNHDWQKYYKERKEREANGD